MNAKTNLMQAMLLVAVFSTIQSCWAFPAGSSWYHHLGSNNSDNAVTKHGIVERFSNLFRKAVAHLVPLGRPQYMMSAPSFDTTLIQDRGERERVARQFNTASAALESPEQLVRAGVFIYEPLSGGIYTRRRNIEHIILHSTETGRPADAPRVIHSWNNKGLRHAGAQFVVDRDGRIYMDVVPDLATVHVDTARTLYGVNNDNSIGIEMVRAGDQSYTEDQRSSVERLVMYLQQRYGVADSAVLGHGFVQPSDRTDPVRFDWSAFWQGKLALAASSTTPEIAAGSVVPSPLAAECVVPNPFASGCSKLSAIVRPLLCW